MIGQSLGRYRIISKLGQGGMGSVWRAADTLLERDVALKVLPDDLAASPEGRMRFLREARSASKLHHPNVAAIYDAGEDGGRIYIAYRLVDGETLEQRMERDPLSQAETIGVGIDIAAGLAHAHASGILHRDISARNVLIEKGRAVIIDFGLARSADQARVTRSGTVIGTVAYMAPELALGRPASVQSDLYSVGVILFELLTGRLPFTGELPKQLVLAAVHQEAPRPSSLADGVSQALDTIIARLLSKEPGDRYRSASELEEALESARAEGADTIVRKRPRGKRPAAGLRKTHDHRLPNLRARRVRLLLGVLLLVIAVVTMLPLLTRDRSADRPRAVAVLPLQLADANQSDTRYLAYGIGDRLAAQLSTLKELRVSPWVSSSLMDGAEQRLTDIARELKVQTLITGSLQQAESRISATIVVVDGETGSQTWAQSFESDIADLFDMQTQIALSAARQLRAELTPEIEQRISVPPAASVEAYDRYLRGLAGLKEGGQEALDVAETEFNEALTRDPAMTDAVVGLGAVELHRYYTAWDGDEALSRAKAEFNRALEQDPGSVAAIAGLIHVAWEEEDVVAMLELAAVLKRSGSDDLETLFARAQANVLADFGDRAEPLLEEIIRRDPVNERAHWFLPLAHLWGGDVTRVADAGRDYLTRFAQDPEIMYIIGCGYQLQGRDEEALEWFLRASRSFDPNPMRVSLLHAGLVYRKLGDERRAAQSWRMGKTLCERALSQITSNNHLQRDLAQFCILLGDVDDMRALLARWSPGPDGSIILGLCYLVAGDVETGKRVLRQGLDEGSYFSSGVQHLTNAIDPAIRRRPEVQELEHRAAARMEMLRSTY